MARLHAVMSVTARHDKRMMRAGDDAELLFYRLLQLAKTLETDGVIPLPLILKEHTRPRKALDALVREGLVRDLGDDDYGIAGWLDWNQSVSDIQQKRADDRARKKRAPGGGTGEPPPPESTGIPDGIHNGVQTESQRSPFGEKSDSDHVKGREGKGREASNKSVGTSSVLSVAGSAPGRLRPEEPQGLNGSIAAVLRGVS